MGRATLNSQECKKTISFCDLPIGEFFRLPHVVSIIYQKLHNGIDDNCTRIYAAENTAGIGRCCLTSAVIPVRIIMDVVDD